MILRVSRCHRSRNVVVRKGSPWRSLRETGEKTSITHEARGWLSTRRTCGLTCRSRPRTLPLFMSALLTFLLLLLVNAQAPASATPRAQSPVVEEVGVSGYVLAPDGTPVSVGTVSDGRSTASIDRTGHFRLVTPRSGLLQMLVSVPGLAPYRFTVTVPASRSLRLPVIRLATAVYFRVRFVSAP